MKIRMMNQIITDPKMQDRECNFALKVTKKQSRWDMVFELLNKINNRLDKIEVRLDRLEADVSTLKSDVKNIYSIVQKQGKDIKNIYSILDRNNIR